MNVFDPTAPDDLFNQLGREASLFAPLVEGLFQELGVRREAVRTALAARDPVDLARQGHAIKASAAQFGLVRLHEMAAGMDHAGKQGDHATVLALAAGIEPAMDEGLAAVRAWWTAFDPGR